MPRAASESHHRGMSKTHATGTIEVTSYNPVAYEEEADGPNLVEIQITETFFGDITGDGAVRFLQALAKSGDASFTGLERVRGTIAGKTGTFVLQDVGALAGTDVTGTWFVVPGSGTGGLAGLRGEGGFRAKLGEHAHWTLDYWFE